MSGFTLNGLKGHMASAELLKLVAVWKLDGVKLPLTAEAVRFMVCCDIRPEAWHDVIANSHSMQFIRAWCLYNRGYDPHYIGHPCPTCGQEVPVKPSLN